MLLSQIRMTGDKLAENTQKIRIASNDSFDIEDEIEFEDLQHKIRGIRKKLRSGSSGKDSRERKKGYCTRKRQDLICSGYDKALCAEGCNYRDHAER